MITEYCPSTLKDSINDENNYKDSNILNKWMTYAYQIANGMEMLSRRGIIHRDLKVENCLIDSNGTIKICDFGLAVTKDTINRMSTLSLSQTVAQGTLGYIAPERLFEGKISDASDVYSYGIIVAYMLFGKFPWVDRSGRALDDVTVSNMIKDGRLPECFDDYNDETELKKDVIVMLKDCCARDPYDRPRFLDLKRNLFDPFLPSSPRTNYKISAVTSPIAMNLPTPPKKDDRVVPTPVVPPSSSTHQENKAFVKYENDAAEDVRKGRQEFAKKERFNINKALHLSLENAYREQKAASNVVVRDEEPYDEAEARKKRQELAKQARFDIKKYPHLRSPDDFAKGIVLHKSKVKEEMLVFQPTILHRSLLVLAHAGSKSSESGREKLAIQMHKNLLGYMGDLSLSFPAMLAHDILRKGFEHKYIRDEIYTQIIKQLSNNIKSESMCKGWQMMCMCVGTFPPSYEFENYLFHFLIERRDKAKGAVVEYATYCLRVLEAALSNGDGTGFIPSVEEIQAYKERPPVLATIYLVDSSVIAEDLPVTPDLNVSKIMEMCVGWLDLRDVRISSLGMFVYDLGDTSGQETSNLYDDLPRTPHPLRNGDFMGDILVQKARQKRKFKFVLKQKIFIPRFNYRGDDQLFERLVYLQAEDNTIVQGSIVVDDAERVVQLVALAMAIAYGKSMHSTISELVEAGLRDFIPPAWRDSKSLDYWGAAVLEKRDALVSAESGDLQDQFLQIVQESLLYGMHWFYIHYSSTTDAPELFKNLPYDLLLGFNWEGMHLYTLTYKHLASLPYSQVEKWGGSTGKFTIRIDLPTGMYEFTVITAQAAGIASIILDNINAVMEE